MKTFIFGNSNGKIVAIYTDSLEKAELKLVHIVMTPEAYAFLSAVDHYNPVFTNV